MNQEIIKNNLKNFKNFLTTIVTNKSIVSKDDLHIFMYPNTNNIHHAKTIETFKQETNLQLKGDWFFEDAQELSKMGHIVSFNIPDTTTNTHSLIIFCPDLKELSDEQKLFIKFIENELKTYENVSISFYNSKADEFYNDELCKEDFNGSYVKTMAS